MSVANKIFTNTLWQVIIRAVNILIGVISLALVTRILGQAGFGYYTTIFAFVQIFMILADFGLYLTLLHDISTTTDRQEENKIVNNIFTIRVLASLLIIILAPIAVWFFPYDLAVKQGVLYFVGVFFFNSLISTLTAVFSKKLEMPKVAIVDFVNKIFYISFLLYYFYFGGNLNAILLTNSITSFLAFILLYLFLRKHVSLNLAWDFSYWKKVFHTTWPLAVTVVLNLVYFKADTLILSLYESPETVGLYGAPYRILEVITTFPHMFMSLILPIFTAAWVAKNTEKINQTLQSTFDFFSILGVLMIVGTWLLSTPMMIMLSGQEFAPSGAILNVLILATVSIFFGTLYTYLVVALKIQKKMIKYFFLAAIIGLLGYIIFIPRFSYWGAAYMTLVVEVLIWVFAYYLVKKHLPMKLNLSVLFKAIFSGLVTFILVWLMKDTNIFLKFIAIIFIYILGLYISRAVDKKTMIKLIKSQKDV
ncbi:flippase [Candidatus Parcubacteria bacterium]|nr:MAG: flippase [Candidatus Parcubacteria bacterium]